MQLLAADLYRFFLFSCKHFQTLRFKIDFIDVKTLLSFSISVSAAMNNFTTSDGIIEFIYFISYILSYSIQHSPSSDAIGFSASPEITRI